MQVNGTKKALSWTVLTVALALGAMALALPAWAAAPLAERPQLQTSTRGAVTLYSLNIPYLNQLYDTEATFDGSCACGPTSLAMVLGYYGRIEPRPMVVDVPYQHVTNYGWAITGSEHRFSGQRFDREVLGCEVYASERFGGLYGALMVNDNYTLTEWVRMTEAIKAHGLNVTERATINLSYEVVQAAVAAGHPVIMTTTGLTGGGHLVVVTGYTSDGRLVVNDPYGSKWDGYPNYNGAAVIYRWEDFGRVQYSWEISGSFTSPVPGMR